MNGIDTDEGNLKVAYDEAEVLQHYPVLQRKLLCTAVTRARKVVVLVGSPKAVAIALQNRRAAKRYTDLSRHLSPMR